MSAAKYSPRTVVQGAAQFLALSAQDTVLWHSDRVQVVRALRILGPTSKEELSSALNLPSRRTKHHLETLRRIGFVSRYRVGDSQARTPLYVLNSSAIRKLFAANDDVLTMPRKHLCGASLRSRLRAYSHATVE